MAAHIMRGIDKLTKRLSFIPHRSIGNVVNSKIFDVATSDDQPIAMENPFKKEQQQCILCKLNITPDYKNVRLLSQFQSVYTGRIYGKHITGLCEAKQKKVEAEILKAQNAGLMGYYQKDVKYAKDPKIFDPNNPFRPHKY
ncbi:28S ribosomal protein S18c, mitochondrial [Venturia canescens]|uniref:28S ribosomal protein S18c, mitochondrial n=1 Tax=Venturia canescens TaxID=32260 RepID=UPI001C9D164A|nr:28S ribosomal protein S18c, mitochondrial [Venturia canescens]